jgi:Homing endonuclease associated repeat
MAKPVRGKRFEDSGAEAVFSAWLTLDPALQYAFLDEAEREMANLFPERDTFARREREAIRAIHDVWRLNDSVSPTVKRYNELLIEHPEYNWPSPRTLKRWLGVGSWNEGLRRCGLPGVADGDALEADMGPPFGEEELRTILRECTRDLGKPPSYSEFHAWAHRPDVRSSRDRVPLSQKPFERIFGTFHQARIAAGVVHAPDAGMRSVVGHLRTAGYGMSKEKMLSDLREVAARLGRSPTASRYTRAREEIYQETSAAGAPRVIASYQSINRHFPDFNHALVEAGLEPVEVRTGPRSDTPQWSLEAAADVLRTDAYPAVGKRFTVKRYEDWRRREIQRDYRRRFELPNHKTLLVLFGPWPIVRKVATGNAGG